VCLSWTKCYRTVSFSRFSVFPCQYHPTAAPHSLINHPVDGQWLSERPRFYGRVVSQLLQPHPVVTTDALLVIGAAVTSAVLSLDERLSQTNTSCVLKFRHHSLYCCFIRYVLLGIRISKCLTNSNGSFQCEVIFENKHTFCSSIHHART
jgi:hypothetical protein